MQKFTRPVKPSEFDSDVSDVRDDVRQKIESSEKPVWKSKWKDYKYLFSGAQKRKCGFCESATAVTSWGVCNGRLQIESTSAGAVPDRGTPSRGRFLAHE